MVLSFFRDSMSQRPGEMPNEQVSAKTQPLRGSETRKEVGRDEENLGDTAWRDPVRPHSSPNAVRKEDCDQDPTRKTAWRDPAHSTWPHRRNTVRVRQIHLGTPAYVKTLKQAPTARRDPHQHRNNEKIHRIELQTLSSDDKDLKDHIIQRSKFENIFTSWIISSE